MGFPKTVKNQMLVSAARHCCVCHRYNGVGVEVHHIVQEADGGPNSYENAIALCFDCHAAAGHYNSRHPRGTKFSPQELRLARKNWLEMVRINATRPPPESSDTLCRYYVCKNFELLRKIAFLDLSDLPVNKPLLCKNRVFHALTDLVRRHPDPYRHGTLWGHKFANEEAFLDVYSHPEQLGSNKEKYPYYSNTRTPTRAEFESLRAADGLVNAMDEHGLSSDGSIAVVGCYEAGCEGIEFQEEYLLRAIWGVFLAVENVSDAPITLSHLEAKYSDQAGFRSFGESATKAVQVELPQAPLSPGMTAIIPVTVLIPPLHPLGAEVTSTDSPDGAADYFRAVSYCLMEPRHAEECLTYGGVVQPCSLSYRKSARELIQNIHSFDLTNFYEIDMHWGCGSCPHLFFLFQDNQQLQYNRELLRSCEGRQGSDVFTVPAGVTEFIIAELEDEVTFLRRITINGKATLKDVALEKGDDLRISVFPGDVVELMGQYQPTGTSNYKLPIGRVRNTLIHNYMTQCKRY